MDSGKVWCRPGGRDARLREVLKVLGPHAQFEFAAMHGHRAPGREQRDRSPGGDGSGGSLDDDSWQREAVEKDKKKSSWKLFSMGRDAVLGAVGAVGGAADAVRRAAQGLEDGRRLGALAAALDGTIWGGFASGLLQQWDRNGIRLQEVQATNSPIRSLCAVGLRLWVGCADHQLLVLSGQSGSRIGAWDAHHAPVVQMAACGDHIITLAAHGGLRAWNLTSPSPTDCTFRAAMAERAQLYTQVEGLKVLAGTWNVGEEHPRKETLREWLAEMAQHAGVVVVGLQEMEVGAGSIAIAAAKETVR